MTQTGWQRTWVRVLTTLLTAGVMVMIFALSTENAEKSDQRSAIISREVLTLLYPDYDRMEPQSQKEVYDSVQHTVRKCAHFVEYAMLGFLTRLCFESWFGNRMKRPGLLSAAGFTAGTAYACSDELHQLSIDGRSGQWTDVVVDGSGVLLGVTLGTLVIRRLNRNNGGIRS